MASTWHALYTVISWLAGPNCVQELFSRLDTSINGKFTLLVRRAVGSELAVRSLSAFRVCLAADKTETNPVLAVNVDVIGF